MVVPRLGSRTSRADGEPSEIWKRFAVAGAVLIAIAFILITFFPSQSSGTSSSTSGVTPAMSASGDAITRWYSGTQMLRERVATDVAAVRGYLGSQNGSSLRPACSLLADDITESRALTTGPDPAAQALFDDGLTGYSDGVTACGNLFDGTQVAVASLQQRVRTGLTTGDQKWAQLAQALKLPLATAIPTATATPTPTVTAGATEDTPTTAARTTAVAAPPVTHTTPLAARTTTAAPPVATTAAATSAAPTRTATAAPTSTSTGILGVVSH